MWAIWRYESVHNFCWETIMKLIVVDIGKKKQQNFLIDAKKTLIYYKRPLKFIL